MRLRVSSSIPSQIDKLNLRNHLRPRRSWSPLRYKRRVRDSISDHYFRPLSYSKKSEKFRKSLTFSNYIHLPSIIILQLANLWKGNAFSSVLQCWPVLKPHGTIYLDQLLKKLILPNFTKNLSETWKLDLKTCSRKVKTWLSMIQLSKKLTKYFIFPIGTISCKSHCHYYFHTLLMPSEGLI